MNAKITLKFNEATISKAKRVAEKHDLSLSGLTEFLYRKLDDGDEYDSIDQIPVTKWVRELSKGKLNYLMAARSRKRMKKEFYEHL